ncbi:hypothetical protein GF325_06100 [Candidatus Bathyarchaeota archaeon]|nr:hypothetical protein [Candidatus Bathyarchaeota archaeon]
MPCVHDAVPPNRNKAPAKTRVQEIRKNRESMDSWNHDRAVHEKNTRNHYTVMLG